MATVMSREDILRYKTNAEAQKKYMIAGAADLCGSLTVVRKASTLPPESGKSAFSQTRKRKKKK